MASAAAMLSGLVVSNASASNLGSLQQQAQAIEARINALGLQASSLSERYDEARYVAQQIEIKVVAARRQVTAATDKAGQAEAVLRVDAVNAYVDNGSSSLSGTGPASTVAGADSSLLRAEYEQSLATNQSDSQDRYELASKLASTAEAALRNQESAAAANVKVIVEDRAQVEAATTSLTAEENQDRGQIATLIHRQAVVAAKAEQAAALQRLAVARAAQQAATARQAAVTNLVPASPSQGTTSVTAPPATTPAHSAPQATTTPTTAPSTGSGSGSGPVGTPPAGSSVAAAAVSYAESRVGDPYVWGAAGPTTFDCSGLVMWAYGQAGVSLPHFSGAQYADTIHISMADLEPGDIVFFSNPDIHEAMYVGNGDVVQAPYPGADVQIVPLYSQFTLATRVG